jgi:hypothetical protein
LARQARAEESAKKAARLMLKDYLTIGFSLAALIVSMTGAYFQYFRFEPGLRLMWSDNPPIRVKDTPPDGFEVEVDISASFVNTGNVALLVKQPYVAGPYVGSACGDGIPSFDLAHFSLQTLAEIPDLIVRPAEIVTAPLHLTFEFAPKPLSETKDRQFLLCIRLLVVDTRGNETFQSVPNLTMHVSIENKHASASIVVGKMFKVI